MSVRSAQRTWFYLWYSLNWYRLACAHIVPSEVTSGIINKTVKTFLSSKCHLLSCQWVSVSNHMRAALFHFISSLIFFFLFFNTNQSTNNGRATFKKKIISFSIGIFPFFLLFHRTFFLSFNLNCSTVRLDTHSLF